ncbi:tegument protein BRRF2 [human gammaherpesvirus 4]|uniref:BRRF2 n=1 Tax=Epstein-Barr virus (strain GD1) TaxID=10376 RepID=A0A0B6VHI8_EBVG|nr:BRRF2 [human gammaherpesvirus 4]QAN39779.1 BRRF2 [human gammaherpesvirus 4]QAP52583.1 BRRF2 [human gammaherpesvirus 4]BAQ20170.1 tegument protein BRRF2 [human gammaherpesvirus 4]
MSGQQRGSVILVPEHLAGALTKLMSDFITGQDVTLSGGNIAVKIRDAINQTPGGGDVAILSSLFALWNALPTSGRQSSRDDLIPAAVQALTTAHNLCLGVIPGETSHKDTPESLLRAIVTGLQKLWVDSCGCPECLQCLKGLKAIKPGLYEIPRIIPHTKQCSPVNLLNMLVHKLVALRGHVQLAYDARVLTPDFHEIPDLDDSDAVFARTLLAALFHLNMFFILKDYITQDSMSLKQALSGHWMSATGNPLPAAPETLRDYLDAFRNSDNHFYLPTTGPLNTFKFPEELLGRVVVIDSSLCAASHVQDVITRGGGAGVPRPRFLALPPAPSREPQQTCSQLTSRGNESSRRNLGQPGGTSPAVPPVCPIVSLAASRAKQNRGGTGSLHLAQPEGTSPAVSPVCPIASPAASRSKQHRGVTGSSQAAPSSSSVAPVASLSGDLEEEEEGSRESPSLPSSKKGAEEFEAWLEAQDANLEDVQREFSGLRVIGDEDEDGSEDGEFSDLDLSDSDHEGDEGGGAVGGGRSLHSLYSLSVV